MKIYLAGPDVFLPDAIEIGRRKAAHAIAGDLAASGASLAIFKGNEAMMDAADAIIANLTPFRGPSADAGTVYELGYMAGRGKFCLAYSNDPAVYVERVKRIYDVTKSAAGHLIDGEETDWMPRARIILAQGPNRRFEPYDRFRHRARNAKRTLDSLLDEFARLRAENLRELESWKLTEAQLDLPGEHPSLGPVTLRQLLSAWVVHDLGHIAQVARVMAKQYRTEVGPWVPYLPVLTDHEKPRS